MIMIRQNSSLVVAIGTFDGVHRGHQYLIKKSLDYYTSRLNEDTDDDKNSNPPDLKCVAVTFDRHPASVVRPGLEPLQLTDLSQKINLLMAAGIDDVRIIKFDKRKSELDACEFVKTILLAEMHVVAIFVGENFRFGYRAAGDTQLLQQLSVELGFHFEAIPLLLDKTLKTTISSTSIRTLISSGDISEANRLLGRSHQIRVFLHETEDTSLLCFCSSTIAFPVAGSYLGSLSVGAASKLDLSTLLTEDDGGSNTISCLDNNLYSIQEGGNIGAGEFLFNSLTITPLSRKENSALNSVYKNSPTLYGNNKLAISEKTEIGADEIGYQFIRVEGFLQSDIKRLADQKSVLENESQGNMPEYRIVLSKKLS